MARAISASSPACFAALLGLATASARRHRPASTSSHDPITTLRYDAIRETELELGFLVPVARELSSLRTSFGARRTPTETRLTPSSGVRPETSKSSTALTAAAWNRTGVVAQLWHRVAGQQACQQPCAVLVLQHDTPAAS